VRVFNINKAIGFASSGVEYAQAYRRELFAGIPWVDDYYVFTDYIGTNLSVFTDRLGFPQPQVLWIYNLVSGRSARPCETSADAIIAAIAQPHSEPEVYDDHIDIRLTSAPVRHRIWTTGERLVDRVDTVVGDRLVRAEHYDATLNNIEYYHQNQPVRRVFFTPDGRVAAEQFYRGRGITRTVITPASPLYRSPARSGRTAPSSFRGDILLEGRSQFFQFVFARLFDRPDDVVIVDRALDVIDGIYPVIGDHRLYSVVHAEHYDLKQMDDGVLLWNNHYENVFTRPELVDGFIVSTHRQQAVLDAQLAARLPPGSYRVDRIPVGFVREASARAAYDRYALVTASRLADEKHLDVLIHAVALARRRIPELRLDIYGEGRRDPLIAAIADTGTADCVRLMGHHRLEGLLGGYGLYVSASTSEGFGLSLLEAIAEGLPIVGFDIDYGNREMVEQGANGCLVPYAPGARGAAALADAIVASLSSADFAAMRSHSVHTAESYTAVQVRRLWEDLLREEDAC
jgi:glycosyltransferase involved in cell wall biosynthesis